MGGAALAGPRASRPALPSWERLDLAAARIVELKFFSGLTMFRVLYGRFLNREGRYQEGREQATRGLAIAEARPEYKQFDFSALGEIARAVADLALAPSAAKRHEVERWLAVWQELPGDGARREAAAQARIAERLGVAVPEGLVAAGDEGRGRGSPGS